MGCRKDLARLTPAERTAFVNAVLSLKASGKYDRYNTIHSATMDPGGVMVHGMPLFFPWHRQLILDYERDLQSIDSSVSLPYWDWTVANLNAAGTESLLWRGDFMGGPGGVGGAITGPFAGWGFTRGAFDPFQFPGTGGQIAGAMTQSTYNLFRPAVEGPHGAAHVWVGGDMSDVMTSPHDPVFFLLHCNVDRIWAEWIHAHGGVAGFQAYQPTSGGQAGQNLNDAMWPWDGSARPMSMTPWISAPDIIRPADVLDHHALGYFYDTIDPVCAPKLAWKEIKELHKEILKDIGKELRKEIIKEHIPEKLQIKETLKEHLPKELKEKDAKEWKEKDKDLVEGGKGLVEQGHFIPSTLRPDLTTGALRGEPDLFGGPSGATMDPLPHGSDMRGIGMRPSTDKPAEP
jgi:tyrosinase-like protein